jgi:hypothetical protein
MAVLALVLIAVWLLLVAGLRTLIQVRCTGDASAPRLRDRPGSPQWWARLLSGVGFACAVAAPLAELAGLDLIPLLDRTPARVAGAVLAVLGIAATLAAQLAMGSSWRPTWIPPPAPPWSPPGRSGWSATRSSPPRPPPPPAWPCWFPTCLRQPCWSRSLLPLSSRSAWLRSPTCTACTETPMRSTPHGQDASCPGSGVTALARGRRRLRPSSRSWLSCAASYPRRWTAEVVPPTIYLPAGHTSVAKRRSPRCWLAVPGTAIVRRRVPAWRSLPRSTPKE